MAVLERKVRPATDDPVSHSSPHQTSKGVIPGYCLWFEKAFAGVSVSISP